MIYISSSCVKAEKIATSVEVLAKEGFLNIELSGGTQHYEGFEDDLLELKDKYKLNYLLHNYFPAPKKHFVLNLASPNSAIVEASTLHIKRALSLATKLDSKKYGIHAGFNIDIDVSEIGKLIKNKKIANTEEGIERFVKNFDKIQDFSQKTKLYIENNVISHSNYEEYQQKNPFLLVSSLGYEQLKKQLDFNLLLDIAHLQVSSKTLNLDYEKELTKLIPKSDYIHISDNDGFHDTNQPIKKDSLMYQLLQNHNLNNKTITLEVYSEINKIKKSYENIARLL